MDWLGPEERLALARLRVTPRRADWRLGRWTAKAAVGAWLGVRPERVQIIAAADGAPEAWLDGRRAPVSVSLSHRAGRALAAVTAAPAVIGCDVELVEPRSGAFVRDWLAPAEQALLATCDEADRARLANLLWSVKEAAAKVRREGLRLDIRQAVGAPAAGAAPGDWRPVRTAWPQGPETAGWWRAEPGWVMAIAGIPAPAAPRRLDATGRRA
ncbi:MAG: 4'-phosphopantetheinyl transferase family protein [Solirubrobacteraceae bacterium]